LQASLRWFIECLCEEKRDDPHLPNQIRRAQHPRRSSRARGKEWIEIAGCRMVDTNVFKTVGYPDDEYTGWAFGFGIERIAMVTWSINNIRLFTENDVRFLEQF